MLVISVDKSVTHRSMLFQCNLNTCEMNAAQKTTAHQEISAFCFLPRFTRWCLGHSSGIKNLRKLLERLSSLSTHEGKSTFCFSKLRRKRLSEPERCSWFVVFHEAQAGRCLGAGCPEERSFLALGSFPEQM